MATALPIAHHNGRQLPLADVHISPLDRGFLFGDGIYEVVPVYDGRPLALERHLARLQRSADAIRLPVPASDDELRADIQRLIDANGGGRMAVYLQATRAGDAGRDHRFPGSQTTALFMMCSPMLPVTRSGYANGIAAISCEDERWGRCDIKSTSLLANVLAKQQAVEHDAIEAILVRDGEMIEGSTSAIGCVIGGELLLPPEDHRLLPSITRSLVVDCAREVDVPVIETTIPMTVCREADELLLMSSTKEVAPIGTLDGRVIGETGNWPIWSQLFEAYQQRKATA